MKPVTDELVAPLRAQLSGNSDEHGRLLDQLDKETAKSYPTMVGAAFFNAVFRRFAKEGTKQDVVDYVAGVRSRSDEVADNLEPTLAERMILAALGHGRLDDVDGNTQLGVQIILLTALVGDEHLDDPSLEEFLTDAQHLANEWITAS